MRRQGILDIRAQEGEAAQRRHEAHEIDALGERLERGLEALGPARLGHEAHGLAKAVGGDGVGGEAAVRHVQLQGGLVRRGEQLVAELLHQLVHLGLQPPDLPLREGPVHGAPAHAVQLMRPCAEGRVGERPRRRVQEVLLLVPDPARPRVDLVGELGVGAVQLLGVDPHDGAYNMWKKAIRKISVTLYTP